MVKLIVIQIMQFLNNLLIMKINLYFKSWCYFWIWISHYLQWLL